MLFLLLLLSLATGRDPSLPSSQTGDASVGTVYFYFTSYTLPRGKMIGMPKISIYCDGRLVGKLGKESFFGVRVPAGRHTFASKGLRTKLEETAIELDVEPGAIMFVRAEVGIGNIKWWAHLRVVDSEEGAFMISKLDPVPADLIEDSSRATVARPTPADLGPGSAEPRLTNADIAALRREGLDDEIVLLKIRLSRVAFDLSPTGLSSLRQEGVSDAVIAAMEESLRRSQDKEDP